MAELHTDEPIRGDNDSPDLLHREHFAKQIAQAICGLPDEAGFTLSIEGPWGYGKTSVLNLIERSLRERDADSTPILCNFNPWMIGSVESLTQSFLVQLASSIDLPSQAEAAGRAANEILSYSTLFTALKFIPGAEPWATIVKDVFDAVGNATEKVARLKKLNAEKQRELVVNALKQLRRRIVVFVDDLDRLPPREVFEMIRLIKAVGDFPGVAYVLCFDPEYVDEGLKTQGLPNASQYLDKVIQARLALPLIDREDLLAMLNREFNALPAEATKERFPESKARHSELYYRGCRYLLETPRDIKRLINRLRFVEPPTRGEINLADLLALELLALKAPTVYQHIRRTPAAYVGRNPGPLFSIDKPGDIVKSYSSEREAVLNDVPAHLKRAVTDLTYELFPLLRKADYGNSEAHNRTRGLVAHPDCLGIALSGGLPFGEASYADAMTFVIQATNRQELIDKALDANKIRSFIEHIHLAAERNDIADVPGFVEILGRVLDTPAGHGAEQNRQDLFEAPLSRLVWWIVERALGQMTSANRLEAIRMIVSNSNLISLSGLLVSHLHRQHGGFKDDEAVPAEKQWVNQEALAEIGGGWAGRMAAAILDRSFEAATLSNVIFFRLKRFYPDVLRPVIAAIVDNDDRLDKFMVAIGQAGIDSTNGRYAKFEPDELEVLGGYERLAQRARERMADSAVSTELRAIYSALVSGNGIYLVDGSVVER